MISTEEFIQEYHKSGCYISETSALRIECPTDMIRHMQKLAELRGDYRHSDQLSLLIRLHNRGFTWIVPPAFVTRRFGYAASLNSYPVVLLGTRERSSLMYTGDIPENILANIALAQEMGAHFFTVHSNQPLPHDYLKGDPLCIAWTANPCILHDSRFSPGWYTRDPAYAVVIGVWDERSDYLKEKIG